MLKRQSDKRTRVKNKLISTQLAELTNDALTKGGIYPLFQKFALFLYLS